MTVNITDLKGTDLLREAYPIINENIENLKLANADIEDSEAARLIAENLRVTQESLRGTAENNRVIEENARVSAETIRTNVESTRQSNESTRLTNESDRQSKETTRGNNEATRVSQESSRVTTESGRVSAESSRATAETSRANAEGSRVSAESVRSSAEANRVSNETSRGNAESNRASVETVRVNAETTRQSNESVRQSQEATRQSDNNAYKLLEAYDNAHSYVPLNKVTYNGSTYQCILASNGNLPTNLTYWTLIAKKGIDGTGAVDSVNGQSGVVVLTASDIGAETPTGAQGKIDAHVAASDPHPQYALDTDLASKAPTNNTVLTGTTLASSLTITDVFAANAKGFQLGKGTGTLTNGINNNIPIPNNILYMTFTAPTGVYSITGFANAMDGRMLVVYFNIAQTLTISHDSANSLSGQRITLPNGDMTFAANKPVRCIFVYDQSVGAGVGYWVLYSAIDGVLNGTTGGGGIYRGLTPPTDTSKLWQPT